MRLAKRWNDRPPAGGLVADFVGPVERGLSNADDADDDDDDLSLFGAGVWGASRDEGTLAPHPIGPRRSAFQVSSAASARARVSALRGFRSRRGALLAEPARGRGRSAKDVWNIIIYNTYAEKRRHLKKKKCLRLDEDSGGASR